ncbi:hypothetical protein D9613_011426 [Agrocybe pediades]|uniref:Uncharacterized protein n=1 Tax=Agrocybe pediades TaxID=84607 RepID=A0A8H4QRR4_9AGAR|nr:hypothetical protein D9613_011426 [Agrocybe pediades]
MSRSGRIHRLPKRTDFKLIPAPLDLSLPLATEKSPLPAIIVTPSSPSSNRDFSIAFLADPPKPTLVQRVLSSMPVSLPLPGTTPGTGKGPLSLSLSTGDSSGGGSVSQAKTFKLRSILFLSILIFILVCHLATHTLAARGHPRLDLTGEAHAHAAAHPFDIKAAFFGRVEPEDGAVEVEKVGGEYSLPADDREARVGVVHGAGAAR